MFTVFGVQYLNGNLIHVDADGSPVSEETQRVRGGQVPRAAARTETSHQGPATLPFACASVSSREVSVVAPVAMQCPEPKRFARTGKNEENIASCEASRVKNTSGVSQELELLVYEAKTGTVFLVSTMAQKGSWTGERVQLETPLIPLTLRAVAWQSCERQVADGRSSGIRQVHNSFNLAPPRGLSFGPVKCSGRRRRMRQHVKRLLGSPGSACPPGSGNRTPGSLRSTMTAPSSSSLKLGQQEDLAASLQFNSLPKIPEIRLVHL